MSNLVDILRPAAEEGNIDLLYTVLKNNRSILEDIDSEQFVDTPLHIAASKGHIPFAIEIMNLKPSFALKLNPEGLSPMHLAILNKRMVLWFVDMNKELVRVKGKGGWTPLHLASQIGDVDILAVLVDACPDSLEDVTVWGQTALHIAAKNDNYDALNLLVSFLRKYTGRNADVLEKKIVNWKDEDDNTILHISAQNNHPKKTMLLLINSRVLNMNAKNLRDKTALDMAMSEEIKKVLSRFGAKHGSQQVNNSRTQAEKIKSKITVIGTWSIILGRTRTTASDQLRNTLLVIFTLIITATYQSVLSPPGGLHQADATDNNANIISSNTNSTIGSAGKSVMSKSVFFGFSYLNMISFSISMLVILAMTPGIAYSPLPMLSLSSFAVSYLYSMWMISPTHSNTISVLIFNFIVAFVMLVFIIISQYYRIRWVLNRRKVIVTR